MIHLSSDKTSVQLLREIHSHKRPSHHKDGRQIKCLDVHVHTHSGPGSCQLGDQMPAKIINSRLNKFTWMELHDKYGVNNPLVITKYYK